MEPETARKSIRPGDVVGFDGAEEDVVLYYRVVDVGQQATLVWGPAALGDQRGLKVAAYQDVLEYLPRERAGDVFQDLADYPEDELPDRGGWEDRRGLWKEDVVQFENVDEDRKIASGDVDDALEPEDVDADELLRELEKEATE